MLLQGNAGYCLRKANESRFVASPTISTVRITAS
jgi:hypothetical protein